MNEKETQILNAMDRLTDDILDLSRLYKTAGCTAGDPEI